MRRAVEIRHLVGNANNVRLARKLQLDTMPLALGIWTKNQHARITEVKGKRMPNSDLWVPKYPGELFINNGAGVGRQ